MSKLEAFDYYLQQPNTPYSLTSTPTELASIRVKAKSGSIVKLAGNVGWIAVVNIADNAVEKVDVVFEIWRNAIGKNTPIYVGRDSAQATDRRGNTFDNLCISSMDHIDYDGRESEKYILSARVTGAADAVVLAPLTFYGAVIDK
jgi:hypothetical protein